MSFLMEVMMAVSVVAVMLGLVIKSYQNCRQKVMGNCAIHGALSKMYSEEKTTIPPDSVKQIFDEWFGENNYKATQTQINLENTQSILSKFGNSYKAIIVDRSDSIVNENSQGIGYLWLAQEKDL